MAAVWNKLKSGAKTVAGDQLGDLGRCLAEKWRWLAYGGISERENLRDSGYVLEIMIRFCCASLAEAGRESGIVSFDAGRGVE